ncbi:MAG TPA: SCE4755 family polysaccharide monooxygenase-like protein, partial [Polyangiaceae bacterium]|nr:SCE4755 family polysaccharide monooxygenase-like protein [Polyangiaceae bacterium]
MKKLVLALSLSVLCSSETAFAHFNLTAPTPNTTSTDGGMGSPPCGVGTASGVITPVQGGHPITIKIDEFVGHTGFYRVALALDSPTELPLDSVVKDASGNILPPSGKPSGISASAAYEDPPVFPVVMDHLFVHTASPTDQTFQGDVTLPNVNCDKCTLQVLEFMQGHPFNTATPPDTGPGGGYFYRHCADLKITADPSMPVFVPSGGGGAGGASSAGSAGTSSGGAATSGGSA